MIPTKYTRLLDGLWLVLLAAYIIAGLPIVTFHGDEAMQIYMSHDYATAFIYREPQRLMVQPPYYIDEDNWLRILNGSINRYAIGLSWHLAGFTNGDLPPRPGWDWGLSYERNVETGHRPPADLLNASRLSSTLFLAASAWLMFAIGWQFGGRLPAYFMSALYTLNPVILLNGRRAMMEGSLLAFGLLTILAAILISKMMLRHRGGFERLFETPSPQTPLRLGEGLKRSIRSFSRTRGTEDEGKRTSQMAFETLPYPRRRELLLWALLALAGGLTLTAKHSGVVFVAGAWGWVLAAGMAKALTPRRPRPDVPSGSRTQPVVFLLATMLKLAAAGPLALALFIALSPALWNDIPARLRDLVEQRQGLLEIQVTSEPAAPTTLAERLEGMITQPFMTAPAHYEVAYWREAEAVQQEIAAYMASPLSGWQFGVLPGLPLTLLAGVGLVALVWPRGGAGGGWQPGLLVWVLVTVASLLVNPLPWQRYYLPWLPVMTVLAGVGLLALLRLARRHDGSPVAEA